MIRHNEVAIDYHSFCITSKFVDNDIITFTVNTEWRPGGADSE